MLSLSLLRLAGLTIPPSAGSFDSEPKESQLQHKWTLRGFHRFKSKKLLGGGDALLEIENSKVQNLQQGILINPTWQSDFCLRENGSQAKGVGGLFGSRKRLVEKVSQLREDEITWRLNKAEQWPPFLAWTFVNMRKLEMLGIMKRTLEGEGRMQKAHTLMREFSSCGAVYTE